MKKSGFLTFLLSFMPGCGLMYLGYMKKGLQMMLMFVASGFLAYFFGSLEWIMAFFIVLLPVIWFYQLFDAMHSVSRMKRLEMEVPTDDGFFLPPQLNSFSPAQNPAVAKVVAGILIFAGSMGLVFGLLDNVYRVFDDQTVRNVINTIRNNAAPAIVSIVLIVVGVKLLKGSKPKTDADYSGKE